MTTLLAARATDAVTKRMDTLRTVAQLEFSESRRLESIGLFRAASVHRQRSDETLRRLADMQRDLNLIIGR